MRTLMLFLILGLVGCANTNPPLQPRVVDPQLESYVQAFEQIWGQQIHFTVELSALNTEYEGMCTIRSDGTRVVDISSVYFPENDENARRQVMFHELGHCALNRGHYSQLDGNPAGCTWDLNDHCDQGYPISIMYPVVFGDDGHYGPNEATYIQELFQNNPSHEDSGTGIGGHDAFEDHDFKRQP